MSEDEPIKLLIRAAFGIQNAQVVGGPAWIETDRYDVEARTGRPEKIEPGQLKPLLQNLLAERFNLKFHGETRDQTVYALVAATSSRASKLKPKAEGDLTAMNTNSRAGKSQLVATAVSMEMLAGYIGNRLGQIVMNKSEMNDSYNFTLEWTPDQATESTAPSLVTALREQLGLRLESRRSPVEVLLIERLERPSEG